MIYSLGIDVGNDATKSDHTTIISGYNESKAVPITGENSCLYMNGTYYTFTSESFPYKEDKTENNRCVILSIMSMAEEIIFSITHGSEEKLSHDEIQKKIYEVTGVELGIGLPVSQFSTLHERTEQCYREFFKEPISFRYNGYEFKDIALKDVYCNVQGYSLIASGFSSEALMGRKGCPIIVDIGGITMDIIIFNPKSATVVSTKSGNERRIYRPVASECTSLNLGSHKMYDHIVREVKRINGLDLDSSDIESVLKGEPNVIPPSAVTTIKELCQSWVDEKIIDACIQNGVNFQTRAVVFMGGTSVLLKEYIEKNPLVGVHEFIVDARANAKGYTNLLRQRNTSKR